MSTVFDVRASALRVQDLTGSLVSCINELIKSKGFQDTFHEEIRKAQELLKSKEEELRKQLLALEEFRGQTRKREDDYFEQSSKRLRTEHESHIADLMG